MGNNTPETVSRRKQHHEKKNKERNKECFRQSYQDNKEKLQNLNQNRYRELSEEEKKKKKVFKRSILEYV